MSVLDLDPLFAQARKEGLWFYHHGLATGEISFSPDELEAEQKAGRFHWGAVNWKLVDPHDLRQRKVRAVRDAEDELAAFDQRMQRMQK